jgi:hypothetical protein
MCPYNIGVREDRRSEVAMGSKLGDYPNAQNLRNGLGISLVTFWPLATQFFRRLLVGRHAHRRAGARLE